MNFTDSEAWCALQDAHLIEIKCRYQHEQAKDRCRAECPQGNCGASGCWVGLRSSIGWVNSATSNSFGFMESTCSEPTTSTFPWKLFEPNGFSSPNVQDSEDCVHMWKPPTVTNGGQLAKFSACVSFGNAHKYYNCDGPKGCLEEHCTYNQGDNLPEKAWDGSYYDSTGIYQHGEPTILNMWTISAYNWNDVTCKTSNLAFCVAD